MKDITCCVEGGWSVDILLYFMGVSYKGYWDMKEKDRDYLLKMHGHLKACEPCRTGYLDFKSHVSKEDHDEITQLAFSSEAFKLARENEELLDRLVCDTSS